MKAKVVVAAVLVAMATHGSSCIREGFLIPVNLPVDQCFRLSAGAAGPFGAADTIALQPILDESYWGNVKAVRFYDVKISTVGSYNGTVRAVVLVGATRDTLLLVGGGQSHQAAVPWSTFSTPQSILGSSPYVATSPRGVASLVSTLNRLSSDESASLILAAVGVTEGGAVPSGLSVCVHILAQADVEMNASGDTGVAN
jgi:hypothetical protein